MARWSMADDRLTQPGSGDVRAYLDSVPDDRRRADALAALDLLREVTGTEPVLWGGSMVGFGTQRYTTADGKEREWFSVGLAPRKAALTFYGLTYYESHQDLLARLGPHTTGKGCLYVKRRSDVDQAVLREVLAEAVADVRARST